jgi:hypothetical protein
MRLIDDKGKQGRRDRSMEDGNKDNRMNDGQTEAMLTRLCARKRKKVGLVSFSGKQFDTMHRHALLCLL